MRARNRFNVKYTSGFTAAVDIQKAVSITPAYRQSALTASVPKLNQSISAA